MLFAAAIFLAQFGLDPVDGYDLASPASLRELEKRLRFKPVIWQQPTPVYFLQGFQIRWLPKGVVPGSPGFQAISLHYAHPRGKIGVKGPDFYVVEAKTKWQVKIAESCGWMTFPYYWDHSRASFTAYAAHCIGIGLYIKSPEPGQLSDIPDYLVNNNH